MPPKQSRREPENSSCRNTRARARRLTHASEVDVTLMSGDENHSHSKRKKRIVFVGNNSTSNESLSNNVRQTTRHAERTKDSQVSPSLGCTDISTIDSTQEKKSVEGEGCPGPVALNETRTPVKAKREARTASKGTPSSRSLTPKSSPIPVALTPHRSAKTPKKSPKNLASPKTHSVGPLRLSKTPRKLPLTSESPRISPRSYDTITGESVLQTKKKLGETRRESTSRVQFVSKTPNKTSSMSMKYGVRRFSKSPKIVLRSPKPKSRKSKSPKLKVTPSKSKVTPRKSEGPSEGKGTFSARKSSSIARKAGPALPETSISKAHKKLIPSSELMADLKNPVVVLQRLSPLSNVGSTPRARNTMKKTTGKIGDAEDIVSPSTPLAVLANDRSSSSVLKSPPSTRKLASPKKLKIAENDVHTPSTRSRESASQSDGNLTDRTRDKFTPLSQPNGTLLVDANHLPKKPLMSSTPHEKKATELTLRDSIFESSFSASGALSTRSNRARSAGSSKSSIREAIVRNTTIENESEPSLCELDLPDTSRNVMLGIARRSESKIKEKDDDDDEGDKDRTYELLEPKTPNLRDKCRKRTFAEADLCETEEKRRCKVRFASPMEKMTDTNHESYSKNTPSMKKPASGNNDKKLSSASKSKTHFRGVKSPIGRSRGAKSSMNGGRSPFISPLSSRGERRSKSFTEINSTLSTSFAFGKKSDPKFSGAKKIPNFAEMHKKMFAKSESLVDAKKRLEERHAALTATNPVPPGKIVASSAGDQLPEGLDAKTVYNRFGFRLRKNEATDSIANKCHSNPSRKKKKQQQQKQESRAVIKGVRTNRRFELQMRARNVNA